MNDMEKQMYLVRSRGAGIFFGEIESRKRQEVVMKNARRLYYWEGATELCQLATEGVKYPKKCKFTMYVDSVTLLEVVEIQKCTDDAAKSLSGVAVWKI